MATKRQDLNLQILFEEVSPMKISKNCSNKEDEESQEASIFLNVKKNAPTTNCGNRQMSANSRNPSLDLAHQEHKGSRAPKCAKCLNHGITELVRGHKQYCPWKLCRCYKCNLTNNCRRVMALQVARRRAQINEESRSIKNTTQELASATTFINNNSGLQSRQFDIYQTFLPNQSTRHFCNSSAYYTKDTLNPNSGNCFPSYQSDSNIEYKEAIISRHLNQNSSFRSLDTKNKSESTEEKSIIHCNSCCDREDNIYKNNNLIASSSVKNPFPGRTFNNFRRNPSLSHIENDEWQHRVDAHKKRFHYYTMKNELNGMMSNLSSANRMESTMTSTAVQGSCYTYPNPHLDLLTSLSNKKACAQQYLFNLNKSITSLSFAAHAARAPNLPPIPFNSVKELENFELIMTEDDGNAMKDLMMLRGGNSTVQHVSRVLKSILTPQLATKYSMKGQRGNANFSSTKMWNLIKASALSFTHNCADESKIEVAASDWFRRANERLKKLKQN